jgi:hypothetical protein
MFGFYSQPTDKHNSSKVEQSCLSLCHTMASQGTLIPEETEDKGLIKGIVHDYIGHEFLNALILERGYCIIQEVVGLLGVERMRTQVIVTMSLPL